MFSDSDLSIYKYLLDSDLLMILWFSFMLLVIACTYMSELHHLIMYCVTAWACQLALSYVLAGLFSDNPGPSCPDPGAWTVVAFCSWSECAAEAWISDCLSAALFLSAPLIGLRDSHLATLEYLHVLFMPCNHTSHLFDVIAMLRWIIPCDELCTCIFLLKCILSLCFWILILTYTDV